MQEKKATGELRHRIFSIVGIVLCVILIPVLIINCTLLVKSLVNKEEVPSFGGLTPLIVLTRSMERDFPAGSLIFSKVVDASEIREGDIISYFDPASKSGAVVTHKVRFVQTNEKGELVFLTYGTFNTTKSYEEITEQDCEVIPASNLVGRYTGVHFKGVGRVAMFMQSTPGLILCVLVPLVLLVGYDIIRRRLYDKKHDNDKEALLQELEELRRLKQAQSAPDGAGAPAEQAAAEERDTTPPSA